MITHEHSTNGFRTIKKKVAEMEKNLNLKSWFQSKTKPQGVDWGSGIDTKKNREYARYV